MKRREVIERIMRGVKDEVVVSSNGMISREVYAAEDRGRNFYMMGSMGAALGIGIGIAYNRPDINVIVINGDGSALMSLGTLALHDYLHINNLKHYILDNESYATTGGQKTCSRYVAWNKIGAHQDTICMHVSNEKGNAPRIPLKPREIAERFSHAISIHNT